MELCVQLVTTAACLRKISLIENLQYATTHAKNPGFLHLNLPLSLPPYIPAIKTEFCPTPSSWEGVGEC